MYVGVCMYTCVVCVHVCVCMYTVYVCACVCACVCVCVQYVCLDIRVCVCVQPTGIVGVRVVHVGISVEAGQTIISDLQYKATVHHAVG